MRRQYDTAKDVFRCYYTDVPLTGEKGSRRYATWEHLTPGDQASVVLAADLVNKMKSDMTDAEFRVMVWALAARFSGTPFVEALFPPDRLRPTEAPER